MSETNHAFQAQETTTSDIFYKIATTQAEREAAFRLVYRSYYNAGLTDPNARALRVTPYHLLPTTELFVAVCRGEPILTMTLVTDGELGLPMEVVYGDEVEGLRAEQLRLAEVTCLADRREHFSRFFPVFLGLSRLILQYCRKQGLDRLMAAVHPRHARFYKRFLGFCPAGPQREYPTVRNNPAVALSLDLQRFEQDRPELHDTFFGQPIADVMLRPQPILADQRAYFETMIDTRFSFAPLPDSQSSATGTSVATP